MKNVFMVSLLVTNSLMWVTDTRQAVVLTFTIHCKSFCKLILAYRKFILLFLFRSLLLLMIE